MWLVCNGAWHVQGEMVQAKFGMPAVAGRQMEVFSTAVLLATHSPPRSPRKAEWRAHMERMSAISCEAYRDVRSRSDCTLHNKLWPCTHHSPVAVILVVACASHILPAPRLTCRVAHSHIYYFCHVLPDRLRGGFCAQCAPATIFSRYSRLQAFGI